MNITEIRETLRKHGMESAWEMRHPVRGWEIVIPVSVYGNVYIRHNGTPWTEDQGEVTEGRIFAYTSIGERVDLPYATVFDTGAGVGLIQLAARAELAYALTANADVAFKLAAAHERGEDHDYAQCPTCAANHICYTDDEMCAGCGA